MARKSLNSFLGIKPPKSNHLGTDWTADGEGERLDVLLGALGEPVKVGDELRYTNLRLTGEPIQEYDRERLRHVTLTGK